MLPCLLCHVLPYFPLALFQGKRNRKGCVRSLSLAKKNLWADGCVDRSWWQMIPSPRKGPMWAITVSVPGHSPSHRQGFLTLREMSEGSTGTEACSWGITSRSRENTSRGCCLEESGPSAWLVRRRQATVSLATRKGTRKKSSTNWSSTVTGDQKLMLRDQKEKSHSLLTGHRASQPDTADP